MEAAGSVARQNRMEAFVLKHDADGVPQTAVVVDHQNGLHAHRNCNRILAVHPANLKAGNGFYNTFTSWQRPGQRGDSAVNTPGRIFLANPASENFAAYACNACGSRTFSTCSQRSMASRRDSSVV